MTLISILLGLALEYFLGALDHLRNRDWFDAYLKWLEMHCGGRRFWAGPAGLLLTLSPPLFVLVLFAEALASLSIYLAYLLAIMVFVYSLGPDFNTLVDDYLEALEEDDEPTRRRSENLLFAAGLPPEREAREQAAIEGVLLCAHEHIFGVIFWFITLGMLGALLYCLVVRLVAKFAGIHGGYADAVRNLHLLLMWPSARLQALGFAVGGSLVDALEGWRSVKGHSLDVSHKVIATSGIWALQYRPAGGGEFEEDSGKFINWIKEAQALANRTLIVWLTVLGLLTLGGWLT